MTLRTVWGMGSLEVSRFSIQEEQGQGWGCVG